MKNFKQRDPQWASKPYAGETMGSSGCGPCACANLLDESPVTIANWLTSHGYASNGSGTYYSGIVAVIKDRGHYCEQITGSRLSGKTESVHFTTLKSHVKSGKTAVLLMGGIASNCKDNRWCSGGHYISVIGCVGDELKVADPWTAVNDGTHPWSHFAGDIKHIFLTDIRWEQQIAPTKEKTLADYYANKPIEKVFYENPQDMARYVGVSELNVRTAPDADAPIHPIYPKLGKDNMVFVIAKTTNNWACVDIAHKCIGWVNAKYLYKKN